jgi:hypothetical protein
VRDALARALAELCRHLAPDDVVAGLDRELGDAGAHGAESDHADRADLASGHDARS